MKSKGVWGLRFASFEVWVDEGRPWNSRRHELEFIPMGPVCIEGSSFVCDLSKRLRVKVLFSFSVGHYGQCLTMLGGCSGRTCR